VSEAGEYLPRYSLGRDLKSLSYALLLHGAIALALLFNIYWSGKSERRIENVIKAKVVLDQPQAEKRPSEREIEPKQPAVERTDKLAEEKARQDAQRKKIALEKKKRLAQQREAAARRRQAQEKRELMKALEAEERERTAQANEARALAAMSEFEGLIRQKITRNWNKPGSVPRGLSCLVRVRLAAGGEILGVSIVKSSGNGVFDRSVENAVYKSAPLPVPEDPELFKYVRQINIRFDPED
jgi:colicin import membrane protein